MRKARIVRTAARTRAGNRGELEDFFRHVGCEHTSMVNHEKGGGPWTGHLIAECLVEAGRIAESCALGEDARGNPGGRIP